MNRLQSLHARVEKLEKKVQNCSCKDKEQGEDSACVENGETAVIKGTKSVTVGSATPILVSSYSQTLAKGLGAMTKVPGKAEMVRDEKRRAGQTKDALTGEGTFEVDSRFWRAIIC